MITMTDPPSVAYATTTHVIEALEPVLAPVRAISKAVEIQLAPIVSATQTVDAALYPSKLMADLLPVKRWVGFSVPEEWFCAVKPTLPALQSMWTPVVRVLLSTPLADVAGEWRALLADLLRPAEQLAGEVTRWMHAALLTAAERAHAVLCTDPDPHRRKAAVEEFVVRWIGLGKQTPARRQAILEAAEDVLLSACWRTSDEVPMDLTLRARLRSRVHDEAQRHRPIWENQVRGRPIDQLDRPVGRGGRGELVTLGQQVPDGRDPYAVLEGGVDAQRRLRAVIPLMKPEHRLVILQYAHGDGLTWREAALRAGLPAEAGESARRRMRRLSAELQRRQLG